MKPLIHGARALGRRVRARIVRYLPDRRANVAAIVAFSLIPLAGVMGLAAEGSNWFLNQRAQQNAADSSVVAAANQALQDFYASCSGGSCAWTATNYQTEGQAVATQYGYTTGGNVTVTVVNNALCPPNVGVNVNGSTPNNSCFKVTITKPLPLFMTKLVGFGGNVAGKSGLTYISASAIAGPVAEPADVCLLTLGNGKFGKGNKDAFSFDGSNGINLSGCPVGSNGGMTCNGHNLEAPWGMSANNQGLDNGCGTAQFSETSAIADPYKAMAVNLASAPYANTCSSYPGMSTSTSSPNVSASSGTSTAAAVIQVCGNLTLSGDFNVTGNEVIVIENGYLDLAGHNFTTSGSGGVTVIFTSPSSAGIPSVVSSGGSVGSGNSTGYIQDSVGGGGLNISNSIAGSNPFGGMTLYQDPGPWGTGKSETNYSSVWDGNSSKTGWDLSGGIYFPNANFTFNGAVDKASNGYECFAMTVNSIISNGGNSFSPFATDLSNPLKQCGLNGTLTPSAYGFRFALVS